MHYHAEVWIPTKEDMLEQVAEVMAPYKFPDRDDEYLDKPYTAHIRTWVYEHGFWDWYQIGGRMKGYHDPFYAADKDPENFKNCLYCQGYGHIYDPSIHRRVNSCNRCGNTGKELKWPTQWTPHEKDIIPIAEILEFMECNTLIIGPECLHSEENGFDGKIFPVLRDLGVKKGYLVTVDYHR